MNTVWSNPGMIFLVGGLGGLFYSHLLKPYTLKLFSKLNAWRKARNLDALKQAYSKGYGWAWAYVIVEQYSVKDAEFQLRASKLVSQSHPINVWFNDGVERALKDIEYFLCLKQEREDSP